MQRRHSPNRAASGVVPECRRARLAFYLFVYRASPLERITMIRRGLQVCDVERVIGDLAFDRDTIAKVLGSFPTRGNRNVGRSNALSRTGGERVIGLAKLVGQLQATVDELGGPTAFDGAAWLAQWLRTPLPTLAGTRPIELIDTMEGQTLISALLAQLPSGAHA